MACTCGLHMLVSSAPGSFGTLIGSLLTDTGTCDVAGPVWLALTSLVLAQTCRNYCFSTPGNLESFIRLETDAPRCYGLPYVLARWL